MKYQTETEFFKMMKSVGVIPSEDERSLVYQDDESVLGFDFTNLTVPERPETPPVHRGAGDRSVEYVMVSVMFKLIESLGFFPVHLYAADNEWIDEDIGALEKDKHITSGEAALLRRVDEDGHGMDILILDKNESADAVRLITPQMTTLSTACAATDEKGRFLASFSQDDEVSFDTSDREVYFKAKKFLKNLSALPFEIVWGDEL